MQSILIHAHSGWRWIVLLLIVLAIVQTVGGMTGNGRYSEGTRKVALFAMIATHIQILLGFVLYAGISDKVQFGPDTMGDSVLRFFAVEHLLTMVLAVILITVGHVRSKKAEAAAAKAKSIFWFYLIALVLMLAGMPWPFRGLGNWF